MLFYDLFRNEPKTCKVAAGNYLFHEGDSGEYMYVLIQGGAEIRIGDLMVEEVNIGDFVGEMAVIDGSPRSATVIATTDAVFAKIDRKRFHFLVDEAPRFAIEVMQVMARRLKQCDARLLEQATS